MKRFNPFFLGIFLLIPMTTSGQSVADDPGVRSALDLIDVCLGAQRDYQDYPGMSAAIVYDQELLWSNGYGFSNIESKIPATPERRHRLLELSRRARWNIFGLTESD